MMKKCLLTIAFAFVTIAASFSQERYLDEVFTGVTKNTVIYGQNFHILFVPVTGHSALQPLVADIYTPTGDTEVQRPLILMFHSGNFLPFPQNQSVNGTRSDSSIVLLSRRLAKMGYVVASIDYRLGWNPVAPEQDTRVNTLINAAYRGVQDARTAIRYFKSNAGNMGS
jgi:acetyl esterase/lipase